MITKKWIVEKCMEYGYESYESKKIYTKIAESIMRKIKRESKIGTRQYILTDELKIKEVIQSEQSRTQHTI